MIDNTPRLKSDLAFYQTTHENELLVGTPRSRIRFSSKAIVRAIQALASGKNMAEVCELSGLNANECQTLVGDLDGAHLIDSTLSSITLTERFISKIQERATRINNRNGDASFIQLQHRLAPELTHTRWLSGVQDGGVAILSARQGASIVISGNNRAATLLFGILLASGVSCVRFAPTSRSGAINICDADLAAGFLGVSDLGAHFHNRMDQLVRELSLFPILKEESAEELTAENIKPDLKVHFGEIDPELLSHWMSTGQSHLIVAEPAGGTLTVGPLVQPGSTPCYRCFTLTAREQSGITGAFDIDGLPTSSKELPVFIAHYLAGLVAAEVLSFIDLGQSDLIGSVLALDYLKLCEIERAEIARHPLCGCNW